MEKLPQPNVEILVRNSSGRYNISSMADVGKGKGPWRPYSFGVSYDPVAWAPLPSVDDKRWRPYRHDTKWEEDVLCLGKFTNSPAPNIHIDSMHHQSFPGFMGNPPPMWGVSFWMSLEEACQNEFLIPQSFLALPTYIEVEREGSQLLEDQTVDGLFLAIINDGDMYRKYFSDACDGKLVNLGRAKRSIIGWRTHDKRLARGFYCWLNQIVRKYNDKHKIFNFYIDHVYSRVTEDLLDYYENIAIETKREIVHA